MPLISTFIIRIKFITLIRRIHLSLKLERVNHLVGVLRQFIRCFLKLFLPFTFRPIIFAISK